MSAEEQQTEREAPGDGVPPTPAPPGPDDVEQVARPRGPRDDREIATEPAPGDTSGIATDAAPAPGDMSAIARDAAPAPGDMSAIAADAAPAPADVPGIAADAVAEPVPPQDVPAVEDDAGLRARADKADEYLALAQRTQADFENFRKRMTRDVRAAEARGMGRLAKELLPAFDNLERAVAALESADNEHHLADGIRLVTAELAAALQRTGIEGYAAKGERFDPVCHEAVAQTPVEGAEPGTIVEVLQAGYRLNDAILRPARVVVAG